LKKSTVCSTRTLDFERDLPTTAEDVRSLRAVRKGDEVGDLRRISRLRNLFPRADQEVSRKTSRDMPPFEL